MEYTYLKPSKIDFKNLKFSRTKISSGNQFLYAYYNKSPICLTLPTQSLLFNSKVNENYTDKIEVFLKIDNEELLTKFTELDSSFPDYAIENSWDTSKGYIPTLKGNEEHHIKFKVSCKDTTFFNNENKQININSNEDILNLLQKGTSIKVGIRCSGVFFLDTIYGASWKADQVKIIGKDTFIPEVEFLSTDEEDLSDEECIL